MLEALGSTCVSHSGEGTGPVTEGDVFSPDYGHFSNHYVESVRPLLNAFILNL